MTETIFPPKPFMSHMDWKITGGGVITNSGGISWGTRFILISQKRDVDIPQGYFNIDMPPDGTVIPGIGGAANRTVTGGKIGWGPWNALYYILPVRVSQASVPGNFRIATYTAELKVPENWVLLAIQNGDVGNGTTWFANGVIVRDGYTSTPTDPYPQYAPSVATIASLDLSGVASATISSIPQTYKDLIILVRGRTRNTTVYNDNLCMRINGNASTYERFEFVASNTGSQYIGTNPTSRTSYARMLSLTTNYTAGGFADAEVLLSDYANGASVKGLTSWGSKADGPIDYGEFKGGSWRSVVTAAVTSLNIFTFTGAAFETGSRVTVLGVR